MGNDRVGLNSDRPNILVFITDDHGQWAQHCYGNNELKTPNLDSLARGGVRMTNAFTTSPVCSPARASFFTGLMPSGHGIHDWLMDVRPFPGKPSLAGQVLLSERLHDGGYHTGLVGKWHCGGEQDPQPGFDYWFSYTAGQYPHRGTQNFSDNGRHVTAEGQQSPLLTDRALSFLENHRNDAGTRDRPFFLFVGYVDTHSPHSNAPDDLVADYADATFEDIPREQFAACHGRPKHSMPPEREQDRDRLMNYYAAVTSIDREVGRIVDDLRANGEIDNTIIVYTADHGLNTRHHGFWEKGNYTVPQNFVEESVKVPLTFHWPNGKLPVGHVCHSMVNHCDLFATLLDVADGGTRSINRDADGPGRSYLEALRGNRCAEHDRDAVFFEYGNARAVRTTRYKFILRYPYKGVVHANELYDLLEDPRETQNIYGGAGTEALSEDLQRQIEVFFKTNSRAGCDGLRLEELPDCNGFEPWKS